MSGVLEFESVGFRYPGDDRDTIDDLSFILEEGEFVSLIGPSGCGKSTIFRLAAGLLQRSRGAIRVGGQPIDGQIGYCGYMPQRDNLLPWRTIRENLRLPMEVKAVQNKGQQDAAIDAMLARVGLSGWGGKRPAELSGGMRQRAAFARTLLTGSELLLLDEPFSALDFLTRVTMQEWLLGLWEEDRKTVLFITHDVEEALLLSSRILVMEEWPVRKLTSIRVPAAYPRTREVLSRPAILDLREELISRLRKQVEA